MFMYMCLSHALEITANQQPREPLHILLWIIYMMHSTKSRQHTLFLYMYIQLNLDFVRNFSHIQCKWSKSTARIGHSKYRRKKQEWLCIRLNIVTVLLSKQNKYSKTRIINDLQPYYHEDKLLILYTFCWLFQNLTEESKGIRSFTTSFVFSLYLSEVAELYAYKKAWDKIYLQCFLTGYSNYPTCDLIFLCIHTFLKGSCVYWIIKSLVGYFTVYHSKTLQN